MRRPVRRTLGRLLFSMSMPVAGICLGFVMSMTGGAKTGAVALQLQAMMGCALVPFWLAAAGRLARRDAVAAARAAMAAAVLALPSMALAVLTALAFFGQRL